MDNRSNEEASWDMPLLSKELGALKGLGFALDLTGFESRELDELLLVKLTEQDDVPPLPAAPTTRVGDLWLLGAHRVLCGDATNQAAVEYLLGEAKPQLMVTDPPYGVEYDPEWRKRAGVNNSDRMGVGSGTTLVACEPKKLTEEEPPSGPTLVACEITERKCLGMELDPRYVDVIITRWQNLTGKEACLDTGETFDSVARSRIEK